MLLPLHILTNDSSKKLLWLWCPPRESYPHWSQVYLQPCSWISCNIAQGVSQTVLPDLCFQYCKLSHLHNWLWKQRFDSKTNVFILRLTLLLDGIDFEAGTLLLSIQIGSCSTLVMMISFLIVTPILLCYNLDCGIMYVIYLIFLFSYLYCKSSLCWIVAILQNCSRLSSNTLVVVVIFQ